MNKKKYQNWGKFAPNLGRLPFLLSGNLFFRIHAKSNKKISVHTLPHSSGTNKQYSTISEVLLDVFLLNITKDCPSNQHPLRQNGENIWKNFLNETESEFSKFH
jgi:hypothetical protein